MPRFKSSAMPILNKYIVITVGLATGIISLIITPEVLAVSQSNMEQVPAQYLQGDIKTTNPLSLTLSKVLSLSQKRHVNVIWADERIKQVIAQIGENRSSFFPQLSASIVQKRQTKNLASIGTIIPGQGEKVGPFNSYDARIKLTQTLFDLAALQRLKAAENNHRLSRAEFRKVKQDVMALVAGFFIEAQRAQEQLELSQILVDRDRLHLEIVQNRFQSGQGTSLDVQHAQVQYRKGLYNVELMTTQALEKRLDLLSALDLPLDQDIVFEPLSAQEKKILTDIESSSLALGLEENKLMTQYLQLHPELETVYQELRMRKTQRREEWAEYVPKISLLEDYGPSGVDPNNFSETYSIGIQASFPIFEGGLRGNRLKEAETQIRLSEVRLNDLGIHLRVKIKIDLQFLQQIKSLIHERQGEWELAQQELALAQRRLDTGMGSHMEFVDAKAEVAMLADQRKDAVSAYTMAQVQLAHDLVKLMDLFSEDGLSDQ